MRRAASIVSVQFFWGRHISLIRFLGKKSWDIYENQYYFCSMYGISTTSHLSSFWNVGSNDKPHFYLPFCVTFSGCRLLSTWFRYHASSACSKYQSRLWMQGCCRIETLNHVALLDCVLLGNYLNVYQYRWDIGLSYRSEQIMYYYGMYTPVQK